MRLYIHAAAIVGYVAGLAMGLLGWTLIPDDLAGLRLLGAGTLLVSGANFLQNYSHNKRVETNFAERLALPDQAGSNRKEFYGATASTAKKIT